MSREEIRAKIDKLENRAFIINMVDRWTAEDTRILAEIEREIEILKNELK